MIVKFNDVEEFLEELKAVADRLAEPVVRITQMISRSNVSPNIKHLSVVSSFIFPLKNGDLCVVRLDDYCGDLWGLVRDVTVKDVAECEIGKITKCAEELNMAVRAGIFDQPEPVRA